MNQKTINYAGVGIIVLLILGLILLFGSNTKNKKNLRNEQTTSETRLFENQKLEGNLEKLKSDFSALKQKSDANVKLLSEANSKIAENEKRINALSVENRSLRANKKELADLKNIKAELEREFFQLKSEHDKLLAQYKDLESKITSLEKEKNELVSQLEKAQLHNTDNFLVTATRGKKTEMVVIFASRAKKLNIAFEVPQTLTETISFKIITPTGTTINPDDKAMSWVFPLDSRNFTASLSSLTGEFEQSRQVVLNYAPKGKLIKGEYKIQILSDGNNIGNCRIKLK
jgi:myosin heavy subunit